MKKPKSKDEKVPIWTIINSYTVHSRALELVKEDPVNRRAFRYFDENRPPLMHTLTHLLTSKYKGSEDWVVIEKIEKE